MTTTLGAINKVLLFVGERQVRTRNSSPASLKAEDSFVSALREFSLFDDWPFLKSWVLATAWTNDVATFDDNVIRVLQVKDVNGVLQQYVDADFRPEPPAKTWRFEGSGVNRVQVPSSNAGTNMTFQVQKVATLPNNENTDIDLPFLAIEAVIKRAVAFMTLRHMDDSSVAAQYSAEYEVMVQALREKFGREPVGYRNMYRRNRF